MHPSLAVVIVNFNTRELLAACLESVAAAVPGEVVVVDNGSWDGSVEMLQSRFPAVALVTAGENLGYGAAANRGVAACSAPVVLVLNTDAVVAADAARAIAGRLAADPAVGIVGPRIANGDSTLQRSTFPFPSALDAVVAETGLHLLLRRIPAIRERLLRTWSHDRERTVPWVLGAVLGVRRSAFEAIGGFDEEIFLYGEEIDLCRRMADAGYTTAFSPATQVMHLGGGSSPEQVTTRAARLEASKRYLLRHESDVAARRFLRVMRAVVVARLARDATALRLARDPEERRGRRLALDSWRAMLRDETLWRT